MNTHMGNTIDSIDSAKAKYDRNVKEILADVQILARILKYTVTEVQDLNIDEIIRCIDTERIEMDSTPIEPGLTNYGKIEGHRTENTIPNEGVIVFDIKFPLIYNNKSYKIIVNIEAQKSTDVKKLGYHLENRVVYYMARLISSQKETEFFKSNYDDLKKIYSIWITMDTEENGDSISKFSLKEENVFGKTNKFSELDKMCGIIIRIREDGNIVESKNTLIAMLEDMLRNEESNIKKQKLTKKYGIKMTEELERRVGDMCNFSTVVEERAIKRGIEKGIEQGIEKGIEQGKIIQLYELVQEGYLTEEEASRKAGIPVGDFRKKMQETFVVV